MGTMTTFVSDGAAMQGYLARPEGEGPFPTMLVIHEVFGLNEDIRSITGRFAKEGYIALAPNLYSRAGFVRYCITDLVKSFMNNKVGQQGVRDLQAAVAYLQALEGVRKESAGVVGFCMGGGFALLLACASDQIQGSVAFYGRNPKPIDAVAGITCPIMFIYGEDDRFIRGGVPNLEDALKRHGKDYSIKSYPYASHSFMNSRRGSYRKDAAEDSWRSILDFFSSHLLTDAK